MKFYSLPRGILRETTKEIPQNLDLKKWWKKMATLMNVPIHDLCCDDDQTTWPVRFNSETGNLERNNLDGTWTATSGDVTPSFTTVTTGAGAVAAPALVVGVNDNGQYEVSSTQQGFSIGNALVGGYNASGLYTAALQEQVTSAGITMTGQLISDKGVVTQITSKTTAVILNKPAGVITSFALTDAADTSFEFTLTNSTIATTSVIQLTALNAGTGVAHVTVTSIASGSAVLRVENVGVASFNSLIKIHFSIS